MNDSVIRAFFTIALMAELADGAEIAECVRTIDVRNLPALIKTA